LVGHETEALADLFVSERGVIVVVLVVVAAPPREKLFEIKLLIGGKSAG
jgi:hypothetical protein